MRNKNAFGVAAVLLAVCLAVGSMLRSTAVGSRMRIEGPLHFWMHVALFALLTLLVALATHSWKSRWPLFVAVLLFAYSTEFYEHLQDGFPVEMPDVLADGVGTCAAAAVWLVRDLAVSWWARLPSASRRRELN